MKTSNLDTVIFDLGAVIINIEPIRTLHALQDLYQKEIAPHELDFEGYESGQYSEKEYLQYLNSKFGNSNLGDFEKAWNAMLLDIPKHRIEYIQELKKTHRLMLLSNTNHTHIVDIRKTLQDQFQTDFEELFEEVFLSYEIGTRKPKEEIYHHVKNYLGENEKALFLDDNLDNVESSTRSGIPAVLVDRDFTHILEK